MSLIDTTGSNLMTIDRPSTGSNSSREQFFESNYTALRKQPPMRWMRQLPSSSRMDGIRTLCESAYWHRKNRPRRLGSGISTNRLHKATNKPVPRRLVWVVNRRVLVQQVFRLANRLQEKLVSSGASDNSLADLRGGLAS